MPQKQLSGRAWLRQRTPFFVNVSAQLLLVLEVILVDEHVLGLRKRGAGEAGGLDVDVPTGQARGQAGVLALLADGQRQLVVGHDDGCVVVLLVDQDAIDLGRGKGVCHVAGRVLIPLDDVDALVAQLLDDHAHAAALWGRRRRPRDRGYLSREVTATLERAPGNSRAMDLISTRPS